MAQRKPKNIIKNKRKKNPSLKKPSQHLKKRRWLKRKRNR
jgi:hypothetical protein